MSQHQQRNGGPAKRNGDSANGHRVMVVEDDEDVNELLCHLLGSEGYQTDPIYNGTDAVQRVEAACPTSGADPGACPDAVVLDVMLPGMDGFEVCRRLKFRRETNHIPIVMLTALADAESRQSGLRVGANRYLTKPFDTDELLRVLRQEMDHARELRAGKTHASVQIQMESDSRHREQLNDMLSELFLHTPLSEEEVGRIRYAVLEMTQNAIEWGNRKQADLLVKIAYEVTDELLKFVITDQGSGFDPANVPHAANEEDPVAHMSIREKLGLREGGFGILISKGMVDRVEYNEKGNEVTLIKYFKR